MTRALLLAAVLCGAGACANGGAADETKGDSSVASGPAVDCKTRFPVNGERCDTMTTAPNAYCRARSCNTGCEDECFCRGNGRWECSLFCRDKFGCGTMPLCGVDCMDAATTPDTAEPDTATDDAAIAD